MEREEVLADIFPRQAEFLEASLSGKYSFILYGGAIRGGKTYAMLILFILLCKKYPGSRWAVVRKDLPTIKKNLYPSWNKIKPTNFIEKDATSGNQTVTFKNGSTLIFFPESYDIDKNLDRWRGFEVNGFGFEEINECQQESLFKAFERAGSYIIPRTKQQPKPIVVATCNPCNNWVKELIYNPWKMNTLRPNWLYIQSTIYDNKPLLKQQPHYLQNLKDTLTNLHYEIFVNGNWDVQLKTGGEFYKSFDLEKHIKEISYISDLPLHISFDDNVNPYLPMLIFQIEGKKVWVIDEITGITPNNTVMKVCEIFCMKYGSHKAGLFVYGDSTAKKEDTKLEKGYNFYTIIQDCLRNFRPTMRILNSNPSVKMRGNFMNSIFENNYNGIEIVINMACKKTIEDFVYLKEAPDGTKHKELEKDPYTKKSYQKLGHLSDCLDYGICAAFMGDFTSYQKNNNFYNLPPSRAVTRNDFNFTL
jgi:Terminase large subunit, T4likevirus-type, N-terminal